MKKLLISLIGAASAMLMATAAETQRGLTEGFEGRPLGAFDPGNDDNNVGSGPILWARDSDAEGESTVEAYAEADATYGSKYLKVDESNAIRRKFANVGDAEHPEGTQADTITLANSGDGIYVNTRVQFTASEEDVTPDPADKLIVWLKETVADEAAETAAATNLIITATDATDVNSNDRIDYVVNNVKVVPGQWYDLKITATRGENEFVPVFTVSLGGTQLTGVSSKDGGTGAPVDKFGSLLARDGSERMKFTSIGFKGNGAIDNVEMGTVVTEAPKNYQVGETYYEDFAAALAAAQNAYTEATGPATLKLLTGVDGGAEGISIAGKVIIDLNGQTVTSSADTLAVYGELTLIDSAGGGTVVSTGGHSLYNDGGTVTIGDANGNADIVFESAVGGTLNIYGGMYVSLVDLDSQDVDFVIKDQTKVMSTEPINGYYKLVPKGGTVTYHKLTLPEGVNATAKVTKSDGSEVSNLSAIEDGTTVTVTWTANEGYKITAGGTQNITMDADKEATAPTVEQIQYATVTITSVDNCDITVKNGETDVTSGAKFDIDDQVSLTVTRTPAKGYALDGCAATETITLTVAQKYTITATVKSYPEYILAGATDATKDKFNAWVEKYSVSDRDTSNANKDAFLLNVAPADAETEAANFKVTAITVNAKGEVTVTVTEKNSKDERYNGTVVIKGKATLGDTEWAPKDDTKHKFFKAFLEVK